MHRRTILIVLMLCSPCGIFAGEIEMRIDGPDGKALPCRMHLTDAAGKPHQPAGLPFWKDHFVCNGRVALKLAPGKYTYEIERGPEWQRLAGALDVAAGREQILHVKLERLTDLARQGWYSGDLHVHRTLPEIELLMRAEDLHVAPV